MPVYSYNNTLLGNLKGISAAAGGYASVMKNNVANGNTLDYSGAFTATANNISQDTSSPDVTYRNKSVAFVGA